MDSGPYCVSFPLRELYGLGLSQLMARKASRSVDFAKLELVSIVWMLLIRGFSAWLRSFNFGGEGLTVFLAQLVMLLFCSLYDTLLSHLV